MTTRSLRCTVLLLAMLCLAALSGCGQTMADVAGVYELDKEAIKAAAKAEMDKQSGDEQGMAALGSAMVLGMIEQMTMTLTLNADGTASMLMRGMGDEDTSTGTWSLEGTTISISMDARGGGPDDASGTVDGDTITFIPPDDEDMPFNLVFKKKT